MSFVVGHPVYVRKIATNFKFTPHLLKVPKQTFIVSIEKTVFSP